MPSTGPGIPDLSSYATFAEGFPHEAFVRLRAEAPVWWHEPTAKTPDGEGFWCVSTHELVVEVFRDAATFSSHTGGDRPHGGTTIDDLEISGSILNMMDDPRHQRIRQLVNKGFTPRMIQRLRGDLERMATATLDAVAPPAGRRGEVDLVMDVAAELPLQAICLLLGVPAEDRRMLCAWVDAIAERFSREADEIAERFSREADEIAERFSREAEETGAATAEAEGAANMFAYGQRLIEERARRPGDDLLSIVIHGDLPGQDPPRLDAGEVALFWSLLFTAGAETTRKAIAGGVWELTKAPEQLDRLRADRSLLPTAVEEIVRWTTPSVYKRRTATRDTVLGGQPIRAGEKVVVWEMSANRDETVFGDPFAFRIDRSPNPHVAFGHGPHFCLGANLARLEMSVMLGAILDRWTDIEVTGAPTWTRTNRLSGLKSLPVAFTDEG